MSDRVVRMATIADMPVVKELWQYAFADSSSFVNWYFNKYVRVAEVVVVEWQGRVAASLQVIAETLEVHGQTRRAGYIVGINTFPEARGQGLTRMMMDFVLTTYAAEEQIDLFLLMPFEAGFYYPYGFVFGTYHARFTLSIEEFVPHAKNKGRFERFALKEKQPDQGCLDNIYNAWQRQWSDFFLRRDDRQWGNVIDDLALEDGQAVIWYDEKGRAAGYLLYHLDAEQLHIREMAYLSALAQASLYYFVASHRSQVGQVKWSAPLDERLVRYRQRDKDGGTLHPFMMYRVQCVSCLGDFASYLPDKDLYFAIVEEDGQVFKWQAGTRKIVPVDYHGKVPTLSQGEITEMIFNPNGYRFTLPQDARVRRALGELFTSPANYINAYF